MALACKAFMWCSWLSPMELSMVEIDWLLGFKEEMIDYVFSLLSPLALIIGYL